MGIFVYILAGIATFFVSVFLMTRYGEMSYDDVFFFSFLCGLLWPVTIPISLIMALTLLIAKYAVNHKWDEKCENLLDRIRYRKK